MFQRVPGRVLPILEGLAETILNGALFSRCVVKAIEIVMVGALILSPLACGGGGGSTPVSSANPPSISPSLSISLPTHLFKPGEAQAFLITCPTETQPVLTWASTGGQISQSGQSYTYTAPTAPGTYSIRAALQDHPDVTSTFNLCVISVSVQTVGNLLEGPGWGYYFTSHLLPDGRIVVDNQSPYGPMIWDPVTLQCARTGSCPIHPQYPDTVVLNGGSLIQIAGGGLNPSPDPHSIYKYDAIGDSWSLVGQTNYLRYMESSTVMSDGRILIAGGETGSVSQNPTMEIWDPKVGGTASVIGYMQTPRSQHTATLLPDGSVLIAGGQYGYGPVNTTEFVTSTLASVAGPSMTMIRADHSAVTLTDGRVLMVGGGTPILEAYDPVKKSFATVGSLNPAIGLYPAVTALPGGRALIAGGYFNDRQGLPMVSAIQIFVPEFNESRSLADLPVPIYGAKAIQGNNGIVYIIGGDDVSSNDRTEILAITVQ